MAGPSGFVAVGGLSDPAVKDAPQGRPAVWTSADGRKWTVKQLPQPSGSLEGWFDRVAVKDNLLVATGTATTSSGRTAFAFASSDGGTSWQEVRLPKAGDGADSSDRDSFSTAVTATAITWNVVRLSGSFAVTVALPFASVITEPMKNAVVLKRERRISEPAAPPPPPASRLPFSPSGICGATDVILLASRKPSPRSR